MTSKITIQEKRSEELESTRRKRKRNEELEDKENTPVLAKRALPIQHQQLTPPLTPARHTRKPIQNLSFTNIIFDHTHRISYSAITEMLQLFLG